MKIAIFSTKPYDQRFFEQVNQERDQLHDLNFFEVRLNHETVSLAKGYPAVCAFVNDQLDRPVLEVLADGGTQAIALRCAGFNNVDLGYAEQRGLTVVRVPAYSPYAVAEHTLALILALNRKIYRAYNRVREANFALDGLLGFDLHGRTAGIVGTGKIGRLVIQILRGFGCQICTYDPYPHPEIVDQGIPYVDLPTLYRQSDMISLHCPLTPETHHLINEDALAQMKQGVMLINTSRGAVIETRSVLEALKSGRVGYLGLDVYEEEGDVFFEDLSSHVVQDDVLARLLTFPNVLITGHQAFFTLEAMKAIAETTLRNVEEIEAGGPLTNQVQASQFVKT